MLILIVAFTAWFGALSIANHQTLRTYGYDLGNADQALWNTAHGRPLEFTNWVGKDEWFRKPTRLGMHVEPIYFLLAPLYWIWPDVRFLLLFQALAVSLGALAAYALGRRHLGGELGGVLLAATYLAHPGLHSLVTSDFHAVALAAPLLLAAYLWLDAGRVTLGVLAILLAMMTKENVPLAASGLGLWLWLRRGRRGLGWGLMALGAAWFAIAMFVVIPAFNLEGRSPYLTYYGELSPIALAVRLLTQLVDEHARRYCIAYLAPLAGLPLLSPATLIAAIPDLLANLLSGADRMRSFGRQYVPVLIAVATAAAAYGAGNLRTYLNARRAAISRWASRIPIVILSLGLLWSLASADQLPWSPGFEWPSRTDHHRLLDQFAAMIPPDASLCTQDNLNPHFTHRRVIHLIPYSFDCEYALIDVSSYPGNNYGDIQTHIRRRLLETGEFGLVAAEDGYALFRRGERGRELPDAFFSFALPAEPDPEIPMSGTFGGMIRFHGYSISPRAGRAPHLSLYFEAIRPLDRDYVMTLYLIEEPGRVAGATVYPQPTLVWYPTSRWRPGQIVRVRANTIDWALQEDRLYAVALGWSSGDDAWDVTARLPYEPGDELVAPRRFQGDTLVYLASFDGRGTPYVMTRQGVAPDWARSIQARIGEEIALTGYGWAGEPCAGGVAWLHLIWEANGTPAADYTTFVHVMDSAGQVVAQGDNAPLGGSWPTTRWEAGDRIADVYAIALPEELPPGDYVVAVGMYLPTSGERLPVSGDGADAGARRVILPAPLTVRDCALTR
ncbi:MAG: hypothetical protein Kow0047_19950 [Anaerolineae bacterium]